MTDPGGLRTASGTTAGVKRDACGSCHAPWKNAAAESGMKSRISLT